MDNSVTEAGVMVYNIQSTDPLTGKTKTLTCTMRPLLESSCPADFMDSATDEEPPTDTVSKTMDPSTSPLTDEALIQELLDWTDGVDDPLMAPPIEVCHHMSSQLLLHVPCRRRSLSSKMRIGQSRLQRFHLRMLRK